MSNYKHEAGENRLLAALPRRSLQPFLANCEHVELRSTEVLCEPGERIRHVHFPTGSFISIVTALDDGGRLEIGLVGDEGMLGTPLILGVDTSQQHASVQGAGAAWRMTARAFARHYEEDIRLQRRLNRYVYVLMGQLAQTVGCARYHRIEARLARWLLMTRDRSRGAQLHLTHEFMAYLLGVRRVGVTEAAHALQSRGLIDYKRGAITILDPQGLEQASCACYAGAIEMYERTMGRFARARADERNIGSRQ